MASIVGTALGEQLGDRLGEAKLGIIQGLKQQSIGDLYGIKNDRNRINQFLRRIKTGAYAPTRLDESGQLAE